MVVVPGPLVVPQPPPPPLTHQLPHLLLGLGPHAHDKVLDVALVDAPPDLEGAVQAPVSAPRVGANLSEFEQSTIKLFIFDCFPS